MRTRCQTTNAFSCVSNAEAEAKVQDRQCAEILVSSLFSHVIEDFVFEGTECDFLDGDDGQGAAYDSTTRMLDLDDNDQEAWSMEYDDADEMDDEIDAAIDAQMAFSFAKNVVGQGISMLDMSALEDEVEAADEVDLMVSDPPEAPRELEFDAADVLHSAAAVIEGDDEPFPAPVEEALAHQAPTVENDEDLELLQQFLEEPAKAAGESVLPELNDLLEEAQALLAEPSALAPVSPSVVEKSSSVTESASAPSSSPSSKSRKPSRTIIGSVVRAPAPESKEQHLVAFIGQRVMSASRSDSWLAGSIASGTRSQRRATPSNAHAKHQGFASAIAMDLGLDAGQTTLAPLKSPSIPAVRSPMLGERVPFSSKQATVTSKHSMLAVSKSTGQLQLGKSQRRSAGDPFAWNSDTRTKEPYRMDRAALAPVF